jgi:hypothetical protein
LTAARVERRLTAVLAADVDGEFDFRGVFLGTYRLSI